MHRGGYTCGTDCDFSESVHPNYAQIGNRVRIRDGVILYGSAQTPVIIGDDVYINARCLLHGGTASLRIGNRVTLACGVVIHTDSGPNTSPLLQKTYPITSGAVTIEDDVWIGTYAVILPGVTIGRGSVIAAHALITRDVPPHSLVGGMPAKVLKTLSEV